jgi:hypothetical protein
MKNVNPSSIQIMFLLLVHITNPVRTSSREKLRLHLKLDNHVVFEFNGQVFIRKLGSFGRSKVKWVRIDRNLSMHHSAAATPLRYAVDD